MMNFAGGIRDPGGLLPVHSLADAAPVGQAVAVPGRDAGLRHVRGLLLHGHGALTLAHRLRCPRQLHTGRVEDPPVQRYVLRIVVV